MAQPTNRAGAGPRKTAGIRHPRSPAETARLQRNARGIYEVHWSEPAPDQSGSDGGGKWRSRRLSSHTANLANAKSYLAEVKDMLNGVGAGGATNAPSEPTIEELCVAFGVPDKGHATLWSPQQNALVVPRRHLGHLRPSELTEEVINAYVAAHPNHASGSMRRHLSVLQTLVNKHCRARKLPHHEYPHIELPPQGQPRKLFLDRQTEARLHTAAAALVLDPDPSVSGHRKDMLPRLGLFLVIAMNTAARAGAIKALTWDRVNLSQRIIDFRVPGRRVSRKRMVAVPISQRLLPVLIRAAEDAPKDTWGRPTGAVIGLASLRYFFEEFAAAHGVPWLTPHVLRHTWGTLAAQSGKSLWAIAGVMGDTVKTIEDNYLHHQPEHLRDTVEHDDVAVSAAVLEDA